jgi:hypothetical protein
MAHGHQGDVIQLVIERVPSELQQNERILPLAIVDDFLLLKSGIFYTANKKLNRAVIN